MAQALKREHRLISLRVELEFWSGLPHVRLTFESGGGPTESWKVPLEELGIATSSGPDIGTGAKLPSAIADRITNLSQLCASTGDDEPLWLHLVRPYGYLGIFPWEAVLGAPIKRPILRLPDFLERSQENPDTLEIAICYDPPWDRNVAAAHTRVGDVIAGALSTPRSQIVVHLFTTPDAAQVLRQQGDRRLSIHDANASKVAALEAQAGASSPWLAWMADALHGRSLDAVHFICATEAADERATLMLRASPMPESVASLSAIYGSEVAAFLQRTGAWAALFSAPPMSGSETSCRYFADGLAQIRPGPVLFHEFAAEDEGRRQLDNVYRFLFAPEASQAPLLKRDFLYCQPSLVQNYAKWDSGHAREPGPASRAPLAQRVWANLSQKSAMIPDFHLPEAPAWTSAAQRFVEKASLDSTRFLQSADSGLLVDSVRSSAMSANNVVQDTLADIQKIIDQHAGTQRTDD